jgi:EamA-like transporter family.
MTKIILPIYVLFTSLALIFIKLGAGKGKLFSFLGEKISFYVGFYTIAGILFYGISFLLYIYLISKNDLGYIIPLTTAFVYIIIFVASFFVFRETFTIGKVLGIGLILGGVILLNISK